MPERRILVFLVLAVLSACSRVTPTASPVSVSVQYTAASAPWLAGLYDCAGSNLVISEPRAADSIDSKSDIAIHIGEPAQLTTPAYQIGTEEILVIVNRITPITSLSAAQVKDLFTGMTTEWSQIDPGKSGPVQVWVFAPGEDVEQAFERAALGGTPLTSLARLANTPDEMSRAIASDQNAIGILPRHWKAGNVTTVYSAVSVPVLAITPVEPAGAVRQILACLSK